MPGQKCWDFDLYDWVERYDARMLSVSRLCYADTLARLTTAAEAKPGQWVLDIGTGTGNSAVPFLQQGCSVVGVDPSRRMVAKAREKAALYTTQSGSEAVFLLVRARNPFVALPFRDGVFDIVASAYAIHHVDDVQKKDCAKEVARVLKPTGVAVVADTMFRDADHKREALALHADLEDEYQPLLDAFPQIWSDVGFSIHLDQVAELVWILTARKR
ncbi:MAG: class I SAM-dependent methyltransferase [Armatimonadota bacterium]